jgi:uridine kinase
MGIDEEISAVAARIEALAARPERPLVVAIDGPSGSGKTTLAAQLSAELGVVPVVHMDSIYPGWDGLDEGSERLVSDVLEPLAAGKPAAVRRWNWDTNSDGRLEPVAAARIVIVEGAGSATRAASTLVDLIVWVDADPDERWRRGIERDGDVFAPHWHRWATQERLSFEREATHDRADVVIFTDQDPAELTDRSLSPER